MKTIKQTSNGISIEVTKNDEYGYDVSIKGIEKPLMGAYTDRMKMIGDIYPYIMLFDNNSKEEFIQELNNLV